MNNGAIVNPYKRMLLKRSKFNSELGTEEESDVLIDEEIIPEDLGIEIDGSEYKPGLTDEEKTNVDTSLSHVGNPLGETNSTDIEDSESEEIDEDASYKFNSTFKIIEKNTGIINGLTEETKSIVDIISNGVGGDVVLTSGLRTQEANSVLLGNVKKSFHLEGKAVDIRTTPKVDAYLSTEQAKIDLAAQGYEIIDERNVYTKNGARIPPHWHIEPISRQKFFKGGLIYKQNG